MTGGASRPQNLHTIASNFINSAHDGHFLLLPDATAWSSTELVFSLTINAAITPTNGLSKNANKKKPKGKFRRFVGKCIGDELPQITQNLFDRFGSKIRATKKTTNYLNFPKDNYITKSYPMPDDGEKFPYKPAELEVKKYKKINLIKYKQSKKKSTKRSKKQKYKELNKLRNNEIL